jgi:hypothetical protein
MPYRSDELAQAERANGERDAPSERPGFFRASPAAIVAMIATLVPAAVFALALSPPDRDAPAPSAHPRLPALALSGAQTTRAHPPEPSVPAVPYGGNFAPGVFGSDGSLALPDGRYAGHLSIESGFASLDADAACTVEIRTIDAACTVEILCGDRVLYAATSGGTLDCDRGSDGGTTMLMDRVLARDDGSPGLVLQHGTEGYRFELFDYTGVGWDRAVVILARAPAISIL